MNLFTLLNANNYLVVNREVAKKIGLNAAIFLSELLDRLAFYEKNDQLQEFSGKKYFYLTMEDAEERTALSRKEQDSAINKLIELGFVEKIQKGLPAKRYFHISEENILQFFNVSKNLSRLSERDKLDSPKKTNYTSEKGQSHIYKEPKEEPKKEPKEEVKPSASVPLAEATELSNFLFTKIKENKEDFKPPNLDSWAKDIDLMIRIDNRSSESIRKVIEWATAHSFWKSNILSASKLRQQFDKLQLQMEGNKEDDWKKYNLKTALEAQKKFPKRLKTMKIIAETILNTANSKDVSLKMKPTEFEKIFLHIFGGNSNGD